MTTMIDRAKEYLTTHGACPECEHPVNDQGLGPTSGWIHTVTGTYQCPPGSMGSWVSPPDPAAVEDAVQIAVEEAEAALKEIMYDEDELREKMDEATEKGTDQGRKDMHAEIDEAIQVAMESAGDDATADQLRHHLAMAWNVVAP